MNIAPSLKNTVLTVTFSTNMLIETNKSAKVIFVLLKHITQWTYDHLPAELYDIPRGKTLFTNIPIIPGTVGYYARIFDCLMKIIIVGEISIHGSIIKKDAMGALYSILSEYKLPANIDLHTNITMIAFIFGSISYYGLIQPSDLKVELERN